VLVLLNPVRFPECGFNQAEAFFSKEKSVWLTYSGAFAAAEVNLNGRRLVLVDDVLTIGTTTSECAAACQKVGESTVCVWALTLGIVSLSN